DLVGAAAEHSSGQDLEELIGIEAALAYQGDDFTQNLQSGRGHHVASELDQVRGRGSGAHEECPPAEDVKNRLAALDVGGSTGRNDEQLTRLRGIRISEN